MSNFDLVRLPPGINVGTTTTTSSTTTRAPSPIEPVGSYWATSGISNSKTIRDSVNKYGINDMDIFSEYIHYYPNGSSPIKYTPSGSLIESVTRFSVYNSGFRDPFTPAPIYTTTTTTTRPPRDCVSTVLVHLGGGQYELFCLDANGNMTISLGYT